MPTKNARTPVATIDPIARVMMALLLSGAEDKATDGVKGGEK